jgi:hypothetical protein
MPVSQQFLFCLGIIALIVMNPHGRAKVRNCKSIFHFPGTPDLLSGDHRLSVYPAVGHITVELEHFKVEANREW